MWRLSSSTARPGREGWGKEEFLTAAARIPGVYVPSLYEVSYHGDGTVAAVTPLEGLRPG